MSRLLLAPVVSLALLTLASCGSKSGAAADSSSAAPTVTAAASTDASPDASPSTDAATTAPDTPDPRVVSADQARIMGDPNAKVWVMVVSDFQCPYCAQWERQTAPQLIKEFVNTGQVRLAFINFPLSQHQNAVPASEAAMCAGAQGKFWEMHDRIFATQEEWSAVAVSERFFDDFAVKLGLDMPPYRQCMTDHVMRPMIGADVERASKGGARSTPTFFIGNQVISGAEGIDLFRATIAQAMADLPK